MISPKMKVLLLAAFIGTFTWGVNAQEAPAGDPVPQGRPNLLRALNLTPDQIKAIREFNLSNRPAVVEGQRRVRDATRELDRALYADTLDEKLVEQKLADLQAAQAEMARLRFNSELAIRRILTPEQLVRFREMRQRFANSPEKRLERREERLRRREGQQRPGLRPPI